MRCCGLCCLLLGVVVLLSLSSAQGRQLRSAVTKASASVVEKKSASSVAASAKTKTLMRHVKLDVGLASFEKNVTAAILAGPMSPGNLSALKGFDEATRKLLVNHTLTRLHQSFVSAMAPMKKDIGKDWMSMPDDGDHGKDEFVNSLRGTFQGIFDRMLPSFASNGGLMMGALKEYPAQSLTLKHAEDAMFNGFNKTVYRIEKTLNGYVEMDKKTAEFMNGPSGVSLIEVV